MASGGSSSRNVSELLDSSNDRFVPTTHGYNSLHRDRTKQCDSKNTAYIVERPSSFSAASSSRRRGPYHDNGSACDHRAGRGAADSASKIFTAKCMRLSSRSPVPRSAAFRFPAAAILPAAKPGTACPAALMSWCALGERCTAIDRPVGRAGAARLLLLHGPPQDAKSISMNSAHHAQIRFFLV